MGGSSWAFIWGFVGTMWSQEKSLVLLWYRLPASSEGVWSIVQSIPWKSPSNCPRGSAARQCTKPGSPRPHCWDLSAAGIFSAPLYWPLSAVQDQKAVGCEWEQNENLSSVTDTKPSVVMNSSESRGGCALFSSSE